ncbi:acetylcholine receptor subunit alpha-like isoform X2 [Littorina saxatilis]|uniref:Uncharacterized protein n=1 Tax=Littorina saxatilis TaxID=31220 RepID=A0AAN9GP05_9CAEN
MLKMGLASRRTLRRVLQEFLMVSSLLWTMCGANDNAKRLYDDLLRNSGYNKLIRPVGNSSDTLIVKLGIRLSQLIDIDEKNQIMTTNVWLRQEWRDLNLQWDPEEYSGIKNFQVPSDDIWLPDLVLFNNADGNYQVTLMTKATLHPNGLVIWEPPAIYKSSCIMNVEFFPFDIQRCKMKFGSWTYDGDQVDLVHICEPLAKTGIPIEKGIDLRGFYPSVEWDLLEVEAMKNTRSYPCCKETYPDITFEVQMRRKTLFHTVNLIIPCVAISFLTVLVFYLPSDSGEKVTLCISILLSLTVFFLLLAEIIPPTSNVVPLIGKYLLFTMILVTLSIIVTVVVLNVHFRSPATHVMSPWVRRVFLSILPRLLIMPRPYPDGDIGAAEKAKKMILRTCNGIEMRQPLQGHELDDLTTRPPVGHSYAQPSYQPHMPYQEGSSAARLLRGRSEDVVSQADRHSLSSATLRRRATALSREVLDAIDSVNFIAEHLKKEDQDSSIIEDWKYVAMVLDRLFLWIFTTACFVGTFGIILQAPTLYDERPPLTSKESTDCYASYSS